MRRRLWIAFGAGAAAVGLVAVGLAVAALQEHRAARAREWHDRAEVEYARGNWPAARHYYGAYLSRVRHDREALLKYADACLRVLEDRPPTLALAASAYRRYLDLEPHDRPSQDRLLNL